MKRNFSWLGVVIMLINYGIDRVAKMLAVEYLKGKGTVDVVGNIFVLVYAENRGAFLSLGTDWPPLLKYSVLLVVPIGLCLVGMAYVLFRKPSLYQAILISTIAGGGLSNLLDRLANDFIVIDYLNFGIGSVRTGILNIADLSVTFGILILVAFEYRKKNGTSAGTPE